MDELIYKFGGEGGIMLEVEPLKLSKREFIRAFAPPSRSFLSRFPKNGEDHILFNYYVDPETDLVSIVLPDLDVIEVAKKFLFHLLRGGDEWEVLRLLGSAISMGLPSIHTVKLSG